MKILGIDPGYDRLGIAIVEKIKQKDVLIHSECFTTSEKRINNKKRNSAVDENGEMHERLLFIGRKIREVIKNYKPDVMSIENLFITKNQKTAMRVSEARGIIIYEAKSAGVPVYEYSPMQIKVAVTGDGSSDKSRIIKMLSLLIKIDANTENNKKMLDDEYDAIAVALTHSAYIR
jgi:crossover junction endodeoxyribonuclease RuvC